MKPSKKKLALWLITPIIVFTLAFLVWQRIQWVKNQNAPINLLEGVHDATFSYDAEFMDPGRPSMFGSPAEVAKIQEQLRLRPKTYLADNKFGQVREEFPDKRFLLDIDSEAYRSLFGLMHDKGWHTTGQGVSYMTVTPRQAEDIQHLTDVGKGGWYSSPEKSDLDLFIAVRRRFEQGKCLFYVYAFIRKPVNPRMFENRKFVSYATMLVNKPELIIVPQQDAKSAIKREVIDTALSLLGDDAAHFVGKTQVRKIDTGSDAQ